MTDTNLALIERFYTAFDAGDGDAMAACYAPDVQFSDPVFTDLRAQGRGPARGVLGQVGRGRRTMIARQP